jgi:hypothetical protein
MEWLWGLAVRSNEQAVANARAATTALGRARVERDEVELYLRRRYASRPTRTGSALDALPREAAR